MQVKTFAPRTVAPIPAVVSPYNATLGTKLLSATKPRLLVNLNLATAAVMQCSIKSPDTGQFYTSQTGNGTNGTDTPFQTFTVSRCSATGTLLDSMTLQNAGHGTSFGIEYSGGVMYLWVSYAQDAAMSQTPSYDILRFPYAAGTFSRATLSGVTVMPKLDAGYALLSFDWAADWVVVRTSSGHTEKYVRRKISEMRVGTDFTYGANINTLQVPPVLQGFTLINNSFFRYVGSQNGEALVPPDPTVIEQHSWTTGKRVDRVAYPDLGKNSLGQFPGGVHEPESCTSYRDPVTGLASLIFGVTLDRPGVHTWPLYIIDDIGNVVQGPVTSSLIDIARIDTTAVVA